MEEISHVGISFDDYRQEPKNDLPESDLEVSYSENSDFGEQYLFNYDSFNVNLSSIDLNLFTVYDFGSVNNSREITPDIISTSRIVVLSIFAVIFMVGLIGNALVIYTVSRYVTMRRVTYLYLLSLSVADIFYLLVCLPTLSVSYLLVDWRFGRLFCKLQNYVMSVTMSVSVLSIVATGLDRYLAVIYPLGARNYRTVKKAMVVISLTWIFSLAVMAPRVILFDETSVWHITSMTTLCNRVHNLHILQIDTSLNFVFMYLLPLTVLCICHSRIGQRLWTSKRPGNALARHGQMRILLVQHKRRIAKMIFAVTAIFAIGWLPIHVYHLVEDFDKGNILFGQIVDRGTIALFFSFGANALNPIIYCLFSSNFRKHFVKALCCWRPRRNTSVNGEDLGYFRSPVTVEIQLENPRPPPVLLPRPASLLTDSASHLVSDHIYIGKLTQLASANILSLQPLLHEESKANSSCSETSPTCSSFSVTTVAQVEVSPLQMALGSTCRQEEDRNPLQTVSSQSTINCNSLVSGCSHSLERANSLARRAYSFTKSQRPRSYDSYRCDTELVGAFTSLKEKFTIQDVSDQSQRQSGYDKLNRPEKTEAPKKYDRRNRSEKTERCGNDKRISPKKTEVRHFHNKCYSPEMAEVCHAQHRRNSSEITEVLHSPLKRYSPEMIYVRQRPDKRNNTERTEANFSDDKISTDERHQKQRPLTTELQESNTSSNRSALTESSTNTSVTTKYSFLQSIEHPIKMASTSDIDVHVKKSISSDCSDLDARNRATALLTKLSRSQTFSSLPDTVISGMNSESHTNTRQSAPVSSSSLSTSSQNLSAERGISSKETRYIGCKYKDKTVQSGIAQCLPPVD